METWFQRYYKEQVEKVRTKIFNIEIPISKQTSIDNNKQTLNNEFKYNIDIHKYYIESIKKLDSLAIISCIKKGMDPNILYHSMSLLYFAILKNHKDLDLIKYLLSNGANIELKNPNIDDISERELNDILIKNYGIDEIIDRYDKTSFDLVIKNGYREIIKLFFETNPKNKMLQDWFIKNKIKNLNLLIILIENNKNDIKLLEELLKIYPKNKRLLSEIEKLHFKTPKKSINRKKNLYNLPSYGFFEDININSNEIKRKESISSIKSLNEQILKQNIFNEENDKLEKIKELQNIIGTQSQNIQNLEKYLQLQLDEINNIKKEFINNQTNQTQYINELVQKIKKLEKENQKNRNIKKQKVSLNIPIKLENKTINQNDGILVKRESFDDF
jgi:hypothetical protein